MLIQLLFVFGLTSVTVLIHSFGTLVAITHLNHIRQNRKQEQISFMSVFRILRIVSALLLLHWIEAGIWAGFFLASGALPDLETAAYFSLTSYTTLGYGDVILPTSWRLLGPFEGAVGILMFGWSTGLMVTVLHTIYGGRLRLPGE